MPPSQNPLAGLFNLFKGSSGTPPSRVGGFPGLGGPPGRVGGYPGPGGGGGFLGMGGPPSGGSGLPGMGGGSGAGSGGLFGLGNIAKNLGKVDIGKVMDGVNNFRNMMSNAQKVASTLNQLGITVGNVQKFMKQVDINGLMNLLGSGDGGSGDSSNDPSNSEDYEATEKSTSRPRKKKKTTSGGTRKRTAKGKKRTTTTSAKRRKSGTSSPLVNVKKKK